MHPFVPAAENGEGSRTMRSPARVIGIAALLLAAVSSGVCAQAFFDVSAPSAILIVADTGQVLFEKDADRPFPPASLAKVMTLLVALEAVNAGEVSLDDPVRASARASSATGSVVYLSLGEVQPLRQLLKAVAIAGANDAAIAVAEYVAGSEAAFVERMNRRARELGMIGTVFANSHGLPPGPGEREAVTTARDMAVAARALISAHPEVLEWTKVRVEPFRQSPPFNLYNTNELVGRYEGLDGLRAGYLEASGWLLIATAQRGETRLISVVMGARDQAERQSATVTLLDYGFQRFVPVTLAAEGVGELQIRTGQPERVPVRLGEPLRLLVPRGETRDVTAEIVVREGLSLPVEAGAPVGEYVVSIGGREALRVPVYTEHEVRRAGFFVRLWRQVRDWAASLLDRAS